MSQRNNNAETLTETVSVQGLPKKNSEVKSSKSKMSEEELEMMRDHEIVEGRFNNLELQNGNLSFIFKKYRDDEVKRYKFDHNEVYKIPRMVADHINNNCSFPVYKHVKNDKGMQVVQLQESVRRFSFEPLSF